MFSQTFFFCSIRIGLSVGSDTCKDKIAYISTAQTLCKRDSHKDIVGLLYIDCLSDCGNIFSIQLSKLCVWFQLFFVVLYLIFKGQITYSLQSKYSMWIYTSHVAFYVRRIFHSRKLQQIARSLLIKNQNKYMDRFPKLDEKKSGSNEKV